MSEIKSIKKIAFIALSAYLCGCDAKQNNTSEQANGPQHINLFPESDNTMTHHKTNEDAFNNSTLVINTTAINYIGETYPERAQSQKVVYLYKITGGTIEKSSKKDKIQFPVYFIKLKKWENLNAQSDSTRLFLIPNKKQNIFYRYLKVNWQLIEDTN